MLYYLLGTASAILMAVAWRKLYPRPYPGIPYNERAARRITGDIPDLVPIIKATDEFSSSVFTATTQKLGVPIAQLLFPGLRDPLIILEDPREIEDIVLRRNKEFDKATLPIDTFGAFFPHATVSQYTTPQLRAQKRLWADVMSAEFLQRAAAPNIYKATLELLDLWRLKASTVFKDRPFDVLEDFKDAALDAIWVAVVGEEPGMIRYQIRKLQGELARNDGTEELQNTAPRGRFVKEEVIYIGNMIAASSNSPSPRWFGRLATLTRRYRQHRATVTRELSVAMKDAVHRFQRLEMGQLEAGENDRCMMDFVLRRQILEAKKSKRALTDPTKDQSMLDEMFVMLVGGHDSTANALTWFVRYMEAYPASQLALRAALKAAFPGPKNPSVEEILGTDVPFLDAACEEGFRLSGVAKGNIRQATVDTQILGCHIPKGAQVFMNFHMDHTPAPVDESKRTAGCLAATEKHGNGLDGYPGRDLGVFEPRRWLVTDEKTGKDVFNHHALPSISFGGGYRGCSGRKLAAMEFRIVITLMMLNLEFAKLPEEYSTMKAIEKVFRWPDKPYARLKVL